MTEDEIELVFLDAYAAYRDEMQKCLHDPKMWIKQGASLTLGLLKLSVVAVWLPMSISSLLGIPNSFAFIIGSILVAVIIFIAPAKICRNYFQERAWAAYDAEVAKHPIAESLPVRTKLKA
ncbi:hypothetical protein [Pseudomonas syringae pv. coryli]|uniref:hypothetical protein n=1 Tax=Pseudomonas syringae pv. coryli TaxID=317659 RepID=UPI003D2E7091